MGNDDQGLALRQTGDGLLDDRFILRVDACGSLVENDDGRILQHGAGDGDTLLFTPGQVAAAPAADGVVALIQLADEIIAPGSPGYRLDFRIGGVQTAHADVVPHRAVKEVVVLRYIGDLAVELFQRDFPQVHTAQGDRAARHIPEAGDELGNGTLTGAGGPHKSGHCPRPDVQAYIVEHFAVLLLVGKGHMIQPDTQPIQLHLCRGSLQLWGVQNGGNLAHIGAHHRQFIHKGHSRYQRSGKPQGQHDDGEEYSCAQTSAAPQQQAHRQDGQQYRGDDRLHDRHILLFIRHPVHIVLGVFRHGIGVPLVGPGGLAERLDHLDASHILHDGICHAAAHLHGALPADGVSLAALGSHHDADHRGHQGGEPHSPIQDEDIDRDAHRHQQIGGHLRQQMSQGGLHPLHPVHNGGFVLAGGRVQDRPHGYPAQFGEQILPHPAQRVIGGRVGQAGRPCGKQRLSPIARQSQAAPGQTIRKAAPFQQQPNHSGYAEVGHHTAGHPQHRQGYRSIKSAVLTTCPAPQHGKG